MIGRQLEFPGALRAGLFKRQEPFVTQIRLEQTTIVIARARDHRLDRARVIDETVVLSSLPDVVAVFHDRRLAYAALQQRYRAVDARVWSNDRRDRYGDALDAAHVVTWTVAIKQPLRNRELARTTRLQAQQRDRIELPERDVPRQLQLAFIVFVVGHLHPFDIELERLAGKQTLAPAIPVVELDEILRIHFRPHQLAFHGALRFASSVESETVVLVVETRDFALHPEIELF